MGTNQCGTNNISELAVCFQIYFILMLMKPHTAVILSSQMTRQPSCQIRNIISGISCCTIISTRHSGGKWNKSRSFLMRYDYLLLNFGQFLCVYCYQVHKVFILSAMENWVVCYKNKCWPNMLLRVKLDCTCTYTAYQNVGDAGD